MKLKFPLFLLISFGLLLISCNNDDDRGIAEQNCKVLKYKKVHTIQQENFYLVELIYNGNLIHIRQNYGNIASPQSGLTVYGLVSEDEIFYDSQNRVSKIVYSYNRSNWDPIVDLFFYEGNDRKPYKKDRSNVSGGYTWHEYISYDTQGRIINTKNYWEDDEIPSESTSFEYDGENLKKYTRSLSSYKDGEIYSQWVYEYSNYDNMKNPVQLIEAPFVEDRVEKYSKNNYRKYTMVQTIPETQNLNTEEWSISNYQYDENGYPLTIEFLCN